MATVQKMYLHAVSSPAGGTLPANTPATIPGGKLGTGTEPAGAATARAMDGTISVTAQVSSVATAQAATSAQRLGHRRFVSPLLAARTFAGADGSWIFSLARAESATQHNATSGQPFNATAYLWRPTTGARVGTTQLNFTTLTLTSTGQQANSVTATWSLTQAIQDGDVIVLDVWSSFTQSMATAYTDTFFYDGTTEASATNCASFLQAPAALTIYVPPQAYTQTPADTVTLLDDGTGVDITRTQTGIVNFGFTGREYVEQSFIARTGLVTQLEAWLQEVGAPTATAIEIAIYDDLGGYADIQPSKLRASVTVPLTTLTTTMTKYVWAGLAIALTPGAQYHLIIRPLPTFGASATDSFNIGFCTPPQPLIDGFSGSYFTGSIYQPTFTTSAAVTLDFMVGVVWGAERIAAEVVAVTDSVSVVPFRAHTDFTRSVSDSVSLSDQCRRDPAMGGTRNQIDAMDATTGWSYYASQYTPTLFLETTVKKQGTGSVAISGGDTGDNTQGIQKTITAQDMSNVRALSFWVNTRRDVGWNAPNGRPLYVRLGTSSTVYWQGVLAANSVESYALAPSGTPAASDWKLIELPLAAFSAVGGISSWAGITYIAFSWATPGNGCVAYYDDVAVVLGPPARNIADPVALTDLLSRTRAIARAVADPVLLADSLSAVQANAITIADTVALGDVYSDVMAKSRAAADQVVLSDSCSPVKTAAQNYTRAPADSVVLADAFSRTRTASKSVADPVVLADAFTRATDKARTVADPVTLGDAFSRQRASSRTVADPVTATDTVVPAEADQAQIVDTLTVSDSISAGRTLSRTVADTVTALDAMAAGRTLTRTVSDPVVLADAVRKDRAKTFADPVTLADALSRTAARQRTVADPVLLADTTVAAEADQAQVADTVVLSDSISAGRTLSRTVADPVVLADAVRKDRAKTFNDPVVLADATAKTRALSKAFADPLLVSDAQVRARGVTFTEPVTVGDAVVKDRGKRFADPVTLADVATGHAFMAFQPDGPLGLVEPPDLSTGIVEPTQRGPLEPELATGAVKIGGVRWHNFTPDALPGLKLWFDASQLGLADGAAVDPWPNLANASVPGAIYKTGIELAPVLRTSILNGKPVVRFAASNGRMRIGSGTGVGGNWTLAYVGRMAPGGYSGGRVVGAIYPPANLLIGYWNGNMDVAYGGGFYVPDMRTAPTTAWQLYSSDTTGAGLGRLFKDGVFLSAGGGDPAGFAGTFAISGYDPVSNAETCDCDIAEVVMYDHALTDLERQQVEGYLRTKWLTGGAAGAPLDDGTELSTSADATVYTTGAAEPPQRGASETTNNTGAIELTEP